MVAEIYPSFFGLNVIECKPRMCPRVTLSKDVEVTPTFREEYDQWLLSFFGAEDLRALKPGQITKVGDHTVMIRSEDLAKIMSEINCKQGRQK